MALDGILLNNLVKHLQVETPLRINRIAQLSDTELVFECYNHKKLNLIFSIDSQSNRLSILSENYVRMDEPNHFVMLLRKHLENGWINSIKQVGLDRVVELKINNTNALGDSVNYRLMVELMGKYANVILVNDESKILDAFNRIPPYENTKRIIFSGAQYNVPDILDKKNPFDEQAEIHLETSFVQQFHGFSPVLDREVHHRLLQQQDFHSIMQECRNSESLYIHENLQFHLIELTHLNLPYVKYPLFEGFEYVYQQASQQQRIKQHTGNLAKIIKRELKKAQIKSEKLRRQYHEAQSYDQYRILGDLLMTFGHQLHKGQAKVTLTDFEGQPQEIQLDTRYDGMRNAQLYYQKYRKLKKGLHHIQEQFQITELDIEYYQGLTYQIDQADVLAAYQIRQELMDKGVLFKKQNPSKKKKKVEQIKYHSIQFDGYWFHYGTTNIQNEHLTFKVAHKNNSWFHIQDGAGAHVVCECELNQLNERLIRFGANLAAYHSHFMKSSSVAVSYTSVSELKKIPKAPLGKVAMGKYRTIYIDPMEPEKLGAYLDKLGTTQESMITTS